MNTEFLSLEWNGQSISIEYRWIDQVDQNRPVIIFLHEGLGSCAMWKNFPNQLCSKLNCHGLLYSRPGYGQSTARDPGTRYGVDFLHQQALEVLPEILKLLSGKLQGKAVWLFGHSDGASIALIFAANFPQLIDGIIALAPHVMVEQKSIDSIDQARLAYQTTDLKEKLARYHDDPDSAFWGWNDIWLNQAFHSWNIENEIKTIQCPLLMVQGKQDEYGTMTQLDRITDSVPTARRLELDDCAHSPHRDQPVRLIEATGQFIQESTNI